MYYQYLNYAIIPSLLSVVHPKNLFSINNNNHIMLNNPLEGMSMITYSQAFNVGLHIDRR